MVSNDVSPAVIDNLFGPITSAIRLGNEKAAQVLVELPRAAHDGQRRRPTLQTCARCGAYRDSTPRPGYRVSSFGFAFLCNHGLGGGAAPSW
jgi:hypothetical protein